MIEFKPVRLEDRAVIERYTICLLYTSDAADEL